MKRKKKRLKLERLVIEWERGQPGPVVTLSGKGGTIHKLSIGIGAEVRFAHDLKVGTMAGILGPTKSVGPFTTAKSE